MLKNHTYESQNTWHRFFAYLLFQILKKEYLRISKYLAQIFCLSPFSNIKKAYLQISKYPFHTNNNFKGNNLHKNHYTNNSHKNNYTNR